MHFCVFHRMTKQTDIITSSQMKNLISQRQCDFLSWWMTQPGWELRSNQSVVIEISEGVQNTHRDKTVCENFFLQSIIILDLWSKPMNQNVIKWPYLKTTEFTEVKQLPSQMPESSRMDPWMQIFQSQNPFSHAASDFLTVFCKADISQSRDTGSLCETQFSTSPCTHSLYNVAL